MESATCPLCREDLTSQCGGPGRLKRVLSLKGGHAHISPAENSCNTTHAQLERTSSQNELVNEFVNTLDPELLELLGSELAPEVASLYE